MDKSVLIFQILAGSSVLTAIIGAASNLWGKKKERSNGYVDGRLQDWKERSERSDKRLETLEHKLEKTQQELAALDRDFASLEQYTAALEVTVRKLDPSAQIPPRPHRARRE